MSKTITIDSCIGCPSQFEHYNGHMCAKTNKWLDLKEIPKDCPLPDTKNMVPLDEVVAWLKSYSLVKLSEELEQKYGVDNE